MADMTWTGVCARRLARHALTQPVEPDRLAELTGVMCGVHAQVMFAAELSIGLRVEGITQDAARDALWTDRSIVKTYGPRGTVHLLEAKDLPMWTGALSAIPSAADSAASRAILSPEQMDTVVEAIGEVLADAELTVDELTDALVERIGAWAGDKVMDAFAVKWPRWRMATNTAANRGALCFGPNRGRNVTYTSPRRWLPGFQPDDPQTALAGLVRRYLYAYGPATPQQFAKWMSAPRRWASDLFASLEGELEQVTLDGEPAWIVVGDTAVPDEPPRGVRLLPYFDAYGIGCHPREKVFPGRAFERALAGGQAGNFPVLLIDGVVAGIWHQRRTGKKLALTVEAFGKLTAAQRRELDAQVARIAEIQGASATMSFGEVTVGPHA